MLSQEKKEKEKALGWHRAGSDVLYKRNEYQYTKPNSTFVRSFYSLQFSIQVSCEGLVFRAMSVKDCLHVSHSFLKVPHRSSDPPSYP